MKFEKIRYLGHSAVFIEGPNYTVAIDPWLEGNPSCPEEYRNPAKIDLIILTHGHSDHAGDAVRLCKNTGAGIVATFELAMILIGQGVAAAKVHPMNKGGTIEMNGFSISLTHAMHSSSYDTNEGPVYAGEACGTVVRSAGQSIYHAGDTALFTDMSLIKERYSPQIALLPIGDRFTMGPEEASQAAQLVGCKIAIPIHYKTFDLLPGRAEDFSSFCSAKGIESKALKPGEALKL